MLAMRQGIRNALQADFNKPEFETDSSELLTSLLEVRKAIRHLKSWMRTQKVSTPIELTGTSHYIRPEPRGVVLILAPWNYPFNLCMIPFIAAYGAGNRIILKPSEFSPHTAQIICDLIAACFGPEEVMVVQGDALVAEQLTNLPLHHIFFTGSQKTAKKILKAASNQLIPVTLELGGKTPVIVDRGVRLSEVIHDIVYGKCLNAGQTCIAPDFVLLPEGMEQEFSKQWNRTLEGLYGLDMLSNNDYSGLIHEAHFNRMQKLIEESVSNGAILDAPVQSDSKKFKIKPVLLFNTRWDHPVMEDEIFGPVLPIISYKDTSEILDALFEMKRPLSLYLFSRDRKWIANMTDQLRSGGISINTCLLNYCNFNLPFGGIQHSGSGFNHGKYGFEAFSHIRAISVQGPWFNPVRLFYPPFRGYKSKLLNFTIKFLGKI